jgi:Bacterial Ig-like domain (group 1)
MTDMPKVVVGPSILVLGDRDGMAIKRASGKRRSRPLARAIAQARIESKRSLKGAVWLEGAEQDAAQVMSKIELASSLFTQIAEGRLDAASIGDQVDALYGLLRRLDHDKRWQEALKLARSLAMLLALLERWLELLKSLKVALSAAEELGDSAGKAWALHELGTLHLAAERHADADDKLSRARDLRKRSPNQSGLTVTEHNLQALCRVLRAQLHGSPGGGLGAMLRKPVPALALAILLLVVGGAAGAVIRGPHKPTPPVNTGSHTEAETPSHEPKTIDVSAAPKAAGAGTATSRITAKVLNAQGEPISGQPVKFTLKPQDGTFSSSSVSTHREGLAETTLTLTSSRAATVSDTVEACATAASLCKTVIVKWEARSTPIVATGPASEVTATAATLNGTLNPNGATVERCNFQYGPSASYGQFQSCASFQSSGSSPEGVSAMHLKLTPDTTYHFRLLADSANGPSYGEPQSFKTPETQSKLKPTVTTRSASEVTSTNAILSGSVNPNGATVKECYFEYGGREGYESQAPCSFLPGSGTNPVSISARLSRLAHQAYYYRLVAVNASGPGYGEPQSFKTPEANPSSEE